MFNLTKEEWQVLWSQIVTLESGGKWKHSKVRAFIALRQLVLDHKDLAHQILEIKQPVSGHNRQLNQIYDVIETMLGN